MKCHRRWYVTIAYVAVLGALSLGRPATVGGAAPVQTGVYDNQVDWRPHIPREKTLITHFRSNGYVTLGAGKAYHGSFDREEKWDEYGVGRDTPCKLLMSSLSRAIPSRILLR